MHNGRRAYAEAGAALARFRARGRHGHPRLQRADPASGVERVLDKERRAPRRLGRHRLLGRQSRCATSPKKAIAACTGWGPASATMPSTCGLPEPSAPLGQAEAIVCTGLRDEPQRDGRGLPRADRRGRGARAALRVRQSRSGCRCRRGSAVVRWQHRGGVRAARRGGVLGRQAPSRRHTHFTARRT